MSPLVFALLCLAGGAGAACRFAGDAAIRAVTTTHIPVATVSSNLTGSLLLGLLAGVSMQHDVGTAYAVLGTGFLGGFTTFSAHAVETVRLGASGARGRAALNSVGTLVAAIGLGYLGLQGGLAL